MPHSRPRPASESLRMMEWRIQDRTDPRGECCGSCGILIPLSSDSLRFAEDGSMQCAQCYDDDHYKPEGSEEPQTLELATELTRGPWPK